jgi:hypothetical protein
MIGAAIVAPVRDATSQYFREHSEGEYKNDELTDDDWEVLEHLNKVLAMLIETTLALEGIQPHLTMFSRPWTSSLASLSSTRLLEKRRSNCLRY